MERQERERQEGSLGTDETLFPEGAPQRHINWKKEDYELFVGHGHGSSAIRVGELQEDPLTRFLLRYDEFETGGELTDGNGKQIKMGKDSEPLRSGKGRALEWMEKTLAFEGLDYVLCQSGECSRVAIVLDRLVESVEKHFVGVGGVGHIMNICLHDGDAAVLNICLHDGDAAVRDGRRYRVVGRRVSPRRPWRRAWAVHAGAIAHPL